jgi:hypothetical protein
MAQAPETGLRYALVCPHCNKAFESQLLRGGAARYQGFKCPHCRLFVALDRAGDKDVVDPPR